MIGVMTTFNQCGLIIGEKSQNLINGSQEKWQILNTCYSNTHDWYQEHFQEKLKKKYIPYYLVVEKLNLVQAMGGDVKQLATTWTNKSPPGCNELTGLDSRK